MILEGGKAVYGAELGILMLEARFPRPVGDMGNARTWPFPVRYRVVPGASPERVVLKGAEGLLDAFIEAGRALVSEGVSGITTNCGFLSIFQTELSQALDVPVLTSALCQVAQVQATLPPGKVAGILTISAGTLSPDHLAAAGVPEGAPVWGVENTVAFAGTILHDRDHLNTEGARDELVAAAKAFAGTTPEMGAMVLECTNMGPYAADIAEATGLPVFSIIDMVHWFHGALAPQRF